MSIRTATTKLAVIASVLALGIPALAQETSPADTPLRFSFSTDHADISGSTLVGEGRDRQALSAVAGHLEFHPFGDEFFFSAGAVQHVGAPRPRWSRTLLTDTLDALPSSDLARLEQSDRLQSLVRYFGAGLRIHTAFDWSMTIEGGAYFQDTSETRLEMLNPNTGETTLLLDDLDTIDREAVGHAVDVRSVKPVGHLVIRRRF